MYVRDAKNREEVWLLDHIEEMGLDETAFRSRDYVVAIDERTHEKTGFGRIRIHKLGADEESGDEGDEACELTSIGVLGEWRGQGIGAHVVERLVEYARDEGFDRVYTLTGEGAYLAQFGFGRVDADDLPATLRDRLAAKREGSDPDATPYVLDVERFRMPDRLRERFKAASKRDRAEEPEPESDPEDFGIDPDEATYKYDTG